MSEKMQSLSGSTFLVSWKWSWHHREPWPSASVRVEQVFLRSSLGLAMVLWSIKEEHQSSMIRMATSLSQVNLVRSCAFVVLSIFILYLEYLNINYLEYQDFNYLEYLDFNDPEYLDFIYLEYLEFQLSGIFGFQLSGISGFELSGISGFQFSGLSGFRVSG